MLIVGATRATSSLVQISTLFSIGMKQTAMRQWSKCLDHCKQGTDALMIDVVYTAAGSSPTLVPTSLRTLRLLSLTEQIKAGDGTLSPTHLLLLSQFLSDNSTLISRYYMYDNASDVFKTDLTGAPATIDVGQAFGVSDAGTL